MPYSNQYSKVSTGEVPVILIQPRALPNSDGSSLNLSQYSNSELQKIGWYRVFEPETPTFDSKIEYLQYTGYVFSDVEKRVERTVSVETKTETDRVRLLNEEAVSYINGKITSADRQTLNDLGSLSVKPAFDNAVNEVKSWIESVLNYQTMKQKQTGASWDYTIHDSTFPYTYEQLINLR